jgi:hypothetical protein
MSSKLIEPVESTAGRSARAPQYRVYFEAWHATTTSLPSSFRAAFLASPTSMTKRCSAIRGAWWASRTSSRARAPARDDPAERGTLRVVLRTAGAGAAARRATSRMGQRRYGRSAHDFRARATAGCAGGAAAHHGPTAKSIDSTFRASVVPTNLFFAVRSIEAWWKQIGQQSDTLGDRRQMDLLELAIPDLRGDRART